MSRTPIVWPGPARLTLVLLAAVPAAMAYPWQSVRERWVLGVAVAVAVLLLTWWRGLHLTTVLARRAAMLRGGPGRRSGTPTGTDVRATAALRVTPPAADADVLPLSVVAGYLDRYGIRVDTIRVTSRDTAAGDRETWIGLCMSAAANLAALQARSSRIPLHETVETAARRLADHLREAGWEATAAGPDDIPQLAASSARELWNAVSDGNSGYVAAYQVSPDEALPETLAAIWGQRAPQTWTAVEMAETTAGRTLAAACALHTDQAPGGAAPLDGLTPQRGVQRAALQALHPLSQRRLDGHTLVAPDLVGRLRWHSAPVTAG